MSITTSLKELSELLNDSQLGYGEAAEKAKDRNVQALLMKIGNGRAPMVEELGNALARMGQEIPDDGTVKGSLHRAWLDIRDALTTSGNGDILAECARGEQELLEKYDQVIDNEQLPLELKDILVRHRELVNSDLNTIRSAEQMIKNDEKE